MSSRVFVDTGVPNSKMGKKHICYDPETGKMFKVDSLQKLTNYGEVYIDSLPYRIYDEAIELLEKNVKIFLLKDAKILKKIREENNLEKTDENDAYMLSLIPNKHFKQLTIEEIETRSLMNDYIKTVREIRALKAKIKNMRSQEMKKAYRNSMREFEKLKTKLAKKIHRHCIENVKLYRTALDLIKLKKSPLLGIICYHMETSPRGIRKLRKYLGLVPKEQRDNNYNHKLREILSNLAGAIYTKTKEGKLKNLENIENIIKNNPKKKALYLLQVEIIKNLRKLQLKIANDNEDYRLAR